jgi:PAS domain S-box-containing protein
MDEGVQLQETADVAAAPVRAPADVGVAAAPVRAAADERLARVERQLAVAQQITHIGSWEWDARTNAVAWSDELYRIYGLEPRSREITFDFFLSRLHHEDRARVESEVRRAFEAGGHFAYPERIVRPDGSIRHLDTVGEVALDENGRAVGLVGTCRDVTEDRGRDETIRLQADIVHHMQIALSVWDTLPETEPDRLRLVAYNPAAEPAARRSLDGCIGLRFREIFPYGGGGEVEELLLAVARDGHVRQTLVPRAQNPAHRSRALSAKAFPLPGGRVGLAVEDVTEITVARRLQDAEHHILERIAAGAPLAETLASIVLAIEERLPPMLGSVLLLDPDGLHIRHGAAPSLPRAYVEAIDGAPIGPRAGSCGTAAYRREAVFVADVDVDPLWVDYRDLARAHGLRACWSTPILSNDGQVLGTFALYHQKPRTPAAEDRAIIDRATHLAGIAIEQRQLEEQLRALSGHVESVREDERTGIAREIHDVLGQALTALKMDLALVARKSSGDSLERIRGMSKATDEIIQQVRRISAELRPGVLDDLGLLAALEWQAQDFEQRTGTVCKVTSTMGDERFARDTSTALFRILQESLTNVARHAKAKHVDIGLALATDTIRMHVRDDGKGITSAALADRRSLGLLGIRERARRLGGLAEIAAGPAGGTVVFVEVPLARGEAPHARQRAEPNTGEARHD